MRELALDSRLAEAAGRVRPGSRVCDVGCDHGKLTAWLLEKGIAASAVAVDISEKSLGKARDLFGRRGLTQRVSARCGDGLKPVEPHEVDDVVIAGLGGDSIVSIIKEAPWLRQADKRLILIPASRHEKLRAWLGRQGFGISQERAVVCSGRLYTVMTVHYNGASRPSDDDGYAAVGEIPKGGGQAERYIEQTRRRYERILQESRDAQKLRQARRVLSYIDNL